MEQQDQNRDVVTDAHGNVYVACNFTSHGVILDTIFMRNHLAGEEDFFLAKFDSMGQLQWAQKPLTSSTIAIWSMSLDEEGNVYIAGSGYPGQITIGNYSSSAIGAFIIKYDSNGNVIWVMPRLGGNTNSLIPTKIISGLHGEMYLAGYFIFYDPVFGTDTLNYQDTIPGKSDCFVLKFDTAGNIKNAISFGGNGYEFINDMIVDRNGNLIIAGNFDCPEMEIDSFRLVNSSSGHPDFLIAKLDSTEHFLWAKSGGGASIDRGESLGLDSVSNIYLAGNGLAPMIFDSISINANNYYLIKLDNNGELMWSTGITYGWIYLGSFQQDTDGNLYAVFSMASDTVMLGSQVILQDTSSVGRGLIVRYDANGSVNWTKALYGTGNLDIERISVISTDRCIVSGSFFNSCLIDTTNYTSNGNVDSFIALMSPEILNGVWNNTKIGLSEPIVFPNPSKGVVNILSENEILQSYTIYDSMGKIVISKKCQGNRLSVDLSSTPPGIYLVKMEGKTGTSYKKLIRN